MTRRLICRALFLALCVAPTLAIAGWSAARLVDIGVVSELADLGHRLDVRIECQQAASPQPGVWRLIDIVIREPESRAEFARLDKLQVDTRGGSLALAGGRLRIDAAHVSSAVELIDRLTRSDWLTDAGPADVRLRCDEVYVGDAEQCVCQWRGVRAQLKSLGDDAKLGRELEVRASGSEGANHDGPRLIVTRNRQLTPAATRVSLQTGADGIPWRLLQAATPADLGPGVTFQGEATLTRAESATEGHIRGRLASVSLANLLAVESTLLKLDAPAEIQIQELAWRDERVERLQALVTAGPGSAGQEWIRAVNGHLRCGASQTLLHVYEAAPGERVAFDELAVVVALDADGLQLRGACHNTAGAPMPCVLAAGHAPLLYHPTEPTLPHVSALRFLAPGDAALRPSSPLADEVARRLPLEAPAQR